MNSRIKPNVLNVTAVLLFTAVIGAILYPLFAQSQNGHNESCIVHLKRLSAGVLIYAAEHDERLPNRDQWMDAAHPYLAASKKFAAADIERCPEVAKQNPGLTVYGYAFNGVLSMEPLSSISDQEHTEMVYDSINLARNASDLFSSQPIPGRHKNLNFMAFVSGGVLGKVPRLATEP